nr:hypothetical protein HmN_000501300 [Hymenolepis microstoma]
MALPTTSFTAIVRSDQILHTHSSVSVKRIKDWSCREQAEIQKQNTTYYTCGGRQDWHDSGKPLPANILQKKAF